MSDSDKDNYSIDEMLERLKSRSTPKAENEPELVTREDGSQVYRVRKRKRRSRQPHKEKEVKRRRRTLVTVSFATIVAFFAGIAVIVWLLYLNGPSYQAKVEDRISKVSGAEVETTLFRATPLGVGFQNMTLKWPETSPVASLRISHASGDLDFSSHLTGQWRGELLRANTVEMVLQAPAPGPQTGVIPAGGIPFLQPIRAGNFKLRMGGEKATPLLLSDGFATLTVTDPMAPQATLVVEKGRLRIWNWGRFDLGVASFKLAENGVQLGTMVFSPLEHPKSEFRLQGQPEVPLPLDGSEATMTLGITNMPSEELLGADMGGLFEATLENASEAVPCTVTADLTKLDSIRVEGAVSSQSSSLAYLKKLPMFLALADLMDDQKFHEPRLELKQPVYFTRDQVEGTTLRDFDFDGRGVLRLRGKITVDPQGNLSGRLDVGIHQTSALLCDSRAFPIVFSRESENYAWGTVELSGKARAPADDLAAQIEAALAGTSPAVQGAGGLEDEFERLTR